MLSIQSSLRAIANPDKAKVLSGFFKTGKGQYGEGDHFLGIQVPDTRKIMKQYLSEMNLEKVEILLQSEFHEERLAGVLTLVEFSKNKRYTTRELGDFYMTHRDRINNWDFVDTSAPQIIGPYIEDCLTEEERMKFIDDCIGSPHLWTNRIIVLASFYNINKLKDERLTFYIVSDILNLIANNLPPYRTLPSPPRRGVGGEELIYKACGWMLREVGKRVSEKRLCEFLDEYGTEMPRTMLRYAIERLEPTKRREYLQK